MGCSSTPTLAELAEQKFRGHQVDVAPAIAPLFAPGAPIDAIALGCTHYTFLLPEFLALYPAIAWFDPAAPVARQTLAVTQHLPAMQSADPQTAVFTAATAVTPAHLAEFGFHSVESPDP